MSDQRLLIAGAGRVGRRTAEQLADQGYTVTMIERDRERCQSLADGSIGSVIQGDATLPSILSQADVAEADAIAALTDEAGTNLAICLRARELHDGIRTVTRIDTDDRREYADVVDAVVLPAQAGANLAADALTGAGVGTILGRENGLEILELTVATDAPVAGRRLDDVTLPDGTLVISDVDRSRLADGDMQLLAGERYLVGVETDVRDDVRRLFRG